jgi:hypothetical protein
VPCALADLNAGLVVTACIVAEARRELVLSPALSLVEGQRPGVVEGPSRTLLQELREIQESLKELRM